MSASRIFGRLRRSRRLDLAVFAVLLLAVVFALRFLPRDIMQVAGLPRVIDGDSLVANGVEMRLVGIDAPEAHQKCTKDGRAWACGLDAAKALRRLIANGAVTCGGSERDKYHRLLAHCRAGDTDLNREMVARGWAVSYDDYRAQERAAREAKRGIWASDFVRPADWRRAHAR